MEEDGFQGRSLVKDKDMWIFLGVAPYDRFV